MIAIGEQKAKRKADSSSFFHTWFPFSSNDRLIERDAVTQRVLIIIDPSLQFD